MTISQRQTISSVSKPLFIGAILLLVLVGGIFSARPVLAEAAAVADAQDFSGEAMVDAASETLLLDVKDSGAADIEGPVVQSFAAAEAQGEASFAANQISDSLVGSSIEKDSSSLLSVEEESGQELLHSSDLKANVTALQSFIDSVATGSSSVTGIYVNQSFSLAVGQQPSGSPGYITGNEGEITQFGMAADYGSKGFLAHNYLSGASFFDLSVGMEFTLVYGDGSTESFVVTEIRQFEALQPNSPRSDFVDLDDGGKLSATKLFHSIYNRDNPVVLQTCIANHGISTWGRLFIIAVPVTS